MTASTCTPRWEVVSTEAYGQTLEMFLRGGWEPFSVTPDGFGHRIWLRRRKA